MRNDSTVHVTRDLRITICSPQGETVLQLSRLSAQVLAATLRALSGLPSKGVDLNAGTFHTVPAEAVLAKAKALPSIQLGAARRGAITR